MWILRLNHMRSARAENLRGVACAHTKQQLVDFVEEQTVEPYQDKDKYIRYWVKTFRKGGPLEWYNSPVASLENHHFYDIGTREDATRQAGLDYDELLARLQHVGSTP